MHKYRINSTYQNFNVLSSKELFKFFYLVSYKMTHLLNLYVNRVLFELREVFMDHFVLKYHQKYTQIRKRRGIFDMYVSYLNLQV